MIPRWVVVLAIVGAVAGLVLAGRALGIAQERGRHQLARAAWERAIAGERLRLALERDSVARATAAAQATADSARQLVDQAVRRGVTLRARADSLQRELAAATTASDSLPILVQAEATQRTRAEAAESALEAARRGLAAQVSATARLRLALDQRDQLVDSLLSRPSTDTVIVRIGPPRLLRAAETVAIGAVTARACEEALVSWGCAAGLVVTAARVL
jgi:hypothetical protein